MKKYMIVTHTDLDGIGAIVVGKTILNKQHIDMKFCGYHNVNETVVNVLVSSENYSHIFITDISVNKNTAEYIETCHKGRVTLLDHHSNLDYLDKYDWATVEPGQEGTKDRECGTSLFYKFLKDKLNFQSNQAMENFVEKVRRYDTWDWHDYYNDNEAKQLNDYFGKIGFFDFINEYVNKIKRNDKELFSESAKKILKNSQRNLDQLVKSKEKQMRIKNIDNYTVGFIFSEIYQSEIGNKLLDLHPELDGIIIYDLSKNKLSVRSTNKSDFDCSLITKEWFGNGGGRKNTGGAQIPEEKIKLIQEILFNKLV